MSARLPTACVTVAALLLAGWCHSRAAAKPPDLPQKNEVICAPAPSPVAESPAQTEMRYAADATPSFGDYGEPPQVPVPSLAYAAPMLLPPEDNVRARADWNSGMRTLQQCLRFAFHPLLTLLPTEQEFGDDDDPLQEMLANVSGQGSPLFRIDVRFGADAGDCGDLFLTRAAATGFWQVTFLPYWNNLMRFLPPPIKDNRTATNAELLPPDLDTAIRGAHSICQATSESVSGSASAPNAAPVPSADAPISCPYLKEQAAQKQPASVCPPEAPATVLENLHKLEQARKLYRRAESCRRKGRTDEARAAYESIRRLCPGSRYDAMAGERLQQMQAATAPPKSSGAAEEQERQEKGSDTNDQTPAPDTRESMPPNQGQPFAALMERYHTLFRQGLYEEAAMCAAQACALDPCNSSAATALRIALAHQGFRIAPSEPSTCPSLKPRAVRRPDLPPVDPHVAADMDRVLTTVTPSQEPPLAVTVEESGGAEEQEATTADQGPQTLYVDPPADKPACHSDSGPHECRSCRQWQDALRSVIDRVRSVACVEVEGPLAGSRGRCQVELGCARFRGSWDRDGRGYFELGFAIGTAEAPDLRAAQLVHDDAVLHWIELRGQGDPADRGAMYALEDELWP